MKNKILKRAFALGCLTLALFCVVKKEDESKKPIIMKQMAVAEEVVEKDGLDDTFLSSAIYDEEEPSEEEGENLKHDALTDEIEENLLPQEDIVSTGGEEVVEDNVGVQETPTESHEVIEYQTDEEFSVLVVGSAHISATPDSAVITARVETRDSDIDLSKENNLAIFDKIVGALAEKGIEKNNIKLECFNCYPCYEFSLSKSITGYCTTSCMAIEVPQIDTVQEYIDILTENGITSIDNICYQVSDMDGQYNNALSQAVQNAKIKAEKLAGQEGLTLVKIKEEVVCSPFALAKRCCDDVKLADYIGNVDIEAKVVAVFEK